MRLETMAVPRRTITARSLYSGAVLAMKRLSNLLYLVWFGALFAGCDGDSVGPAEVPPIDSGSASTDGSGTDPDTDNGALRGPCPPDRALGGLEISAAADFSLIDGKFSDGVVPASVLTRELEAGDCALWRGENPTCSPACLSGETCDFNGQCIPYPVQQDAGVITISGLSEPVSLEPLPPGNTYSKVDLTHPAFAPGAPIEMTSTDGYFGVLSLRGTGVAPLVNQDLEWAIAPGQPLAVTWEAPAMDTGSRIQLYMNIDQHGHTPLTLICEFPDTGQAEVPTSLIDALIATGTSGRPSGRLTRRTVDSVDVADGCVEFRITSALSATVRVMEAGQ